MAKSVRCHCLSLEIVVICSVAARSCGRQRAGASSSVRGIRRGHASVKPPDSGQRVHRLRAALPHGLSDPMPARLEGVAHVLVAGVDGEAPELVEPDGFACIEVMDARRIAPAIPDVVKAAGRGGTAARQARALRRGRRCRAPSENRPPTVQAARQKARGSMPCNRSAHA